MGKELKTEPVAFSSKKSNTKKRRQNPEESGTGKYMRNHTTISNLLD